MKKIEIILEEDVFTTDYPHIVDTTFYIHAQGKAFPHELWTDFTYPVLDIWANTLLDNKDRGEVAYSLFFMDGPYRLDVVKGKDMNLLIQCVSSRKEEKTELTIECDYSDFLMIVYQAIRKFGKVMFNNNMHQGKFETVYRQVISNGKKVKAVIDSFK